MVVWPCMTEIVGSQPTSEWEKWKFCTHNVPKFVHPPFTGIGSLGRNYAKSRYFRWTVYKLLFFLYLELLQMSAAEARQGA